MWSTSLGLSFVSSLTSSISLSIISSLESELAQRTLCAAPFKNVAAKIYLETMILLRFQVTRLDNIFTILEFCKCISHWPNSMTPATRLQPFVFPVNQRCFGDKSFIFHLVVWFLVGFGNLRDSWHQHFKHYILFLFLTINFSVRTKILIFVHFWPILFDQIFPLS